MKTYLEVLLAPGLAPAKILEIFSYDCIFTLTHSTHIKMGESFHRTIKNKSNTVYYVKVNDQKTFTPVDTLY